jgi:hypothetical protein
MAYNRGMQPIRSLILVLLVAVAASVGAQSLPRTIPKDAKAGELSHITENLLSLDGKTVRLAPGGTIRAQNDMVITPMSLKRNSIVRYTTDADGNLAKVWVLTPEEAKTANIGFKMPWSTSPELGRSINQILPAGNTATQQSAGQAP